jgi:hypothetical protein
MGVSARVENVVWKLKRGDQQKGGKSGHPRLEGGFDRERGIVDVPFRIYNRQFNPVKS